MVQILLLTRIAMSYFLYKNRHRAKALLLGFLNFEVFLVVEVMSSPSFLACRTIP